MRGGQVSIEYLIVTGFSFLILIPLVLLFFTQSDAIRSDLIEAQATTAAEALAESAQRVYFSGPPSKETVRVSFPQGLQSVEAANTSIVITVNEPWVYDIVVHSEAPLMPAAFSPTQGKQTFSVEATVGGVQITAQ